MCQGALEFYEKALSVKYAGSSIPALNTLFNLALLLSSQGDLDASRAMYLKTLIGHQEVFGVDYHRCQTVEQELVVLHAGIRRREKYINRRNE